MTEQDEKTLSEKIVFTIQGYLTDDSLSDLQKLLIIHLTLTSYVNTLHYEEYIQFSKANKAQEK